MDQLIQKISTISFPKYIAYIEETQTLKPSRMVII